MEGLPSLVRPLPRGDLRDGGNVARVHRVDDATTEILTQAGAAPAQIPAPPWFEVGADGVRLLRDGAEAYPEMLAAIAASKNEILLEMYWLGSDPVGRLFIDALIERARAGCTVRVVYDAVGSRPVDPAMFERLRDAGGDVRVFHPLGGLSRVAIIRALLRDHRKVLVCDGELGFTGGLNIASAWGTLKSGGAAWRDDMIEVRGPGAGELRSAFYDTWRRVLSIRERRTPALLPRTTSLLSRNPQRDVWVIATSFRRGFPSRRRIRATFLHWIDGARRSICISNAYFVPDRRVRRALIRAVERGVDVRIMVPASGDLQWVQLAVEASLETLVTRGVRAFAYSSTMLHSKSAVVDDELVTIGSYNLDHRSFRSNLELNLAVRNQPFAVHVRDAFDRDVATSTPWTADALARRGIMRRILGRIVLNFARFL